LSLGRENSRVATPKLASARLVGADGGPLRVDVRSGERPGERRPAVVICHGFKGFKDWGFFPRLAERLALAGFTAVSFNFSGSGVGEGQEFDELERFAHQRPSGDLADLAGVVDWVVRERGVPWVGLLGHSRGGGLAILQAARDARVRALATWAAVDHLLRWPAEQIAQWRRDGRTEVVNQRTGQVLTLYRDALDDVDAHEHDTLDIPAAAGRVTVPWLLVHGTADQAVPVAAAYVLARSTGSRQTELLLLDGADHTFGIRHPWQGSTPEFDEVLERTVGLFAQAVR
jgi:dienelactone hydrolase